MSGIRKCRRGHALLQIKQIKQLDLREQEARQTYRF